MHAFVDESERNGAYLMCAVVVAPRHLAEIRRGLVALCLPGQRRLHLTKERAPRKRLILDRIAAMPLSALIFTGRGSVTSARRACLVAMVPRLLAARTNRLVIEPVESLVAHDRGLLVEALHDAGAVDLSYEHVLARHEPALWAADAIAWAMGAGNDWRRRISGVVVSEVETSAKQRETRIPTVRRRPGSTSSGSTPWQNSSYARQRRPD